MRGVAIRREIRGDSRLRHAQHIFPEMRSKRLWVLVHSFQSTLQSWKASDRLLIEVAKYRGKAKESAQLFDFIMLPLCNSRTCEESTVRKAFDMTR